MHETIILVNSWLHEINTDIALDDDGNTIIQRDPHTAILLEVTEGTRLCYFCAPVTTLPEYNPAAGLHTALTLNQYGRPLCGCWLAWEPEINMLCLCHSLYLHKADAISFNNTLQNFMIALDEAREKLINTTHKYPFHLQLPSTAVYGFARN